MNIKRSILLLALALSANISLSALNYVWIEGEDYTDSSHDVDGRFKPENDAQAALFSEGKWLNGVYEDMEEGEAFAEYEFNVEKTGNYTFYMRKFWHHGPFRWKIDDGKWNVIDYSPNFIDEVNIRRFVEATWVEAGSTDLSRGEHTLRIEMLKREHNISRGFGIDAMIFSDMYIQPKGKTKPEDQEAKAMEGMFAFDPPPEGFEDDSVFDLSYLNEDVAGQDGYMYADGEDLYLGSGEKVRLWGVNLENKSLGYPTLKHMAKLYAKRGVNIVRLFWPLFQRSSPDEIDAIDENLLQSYHSAIAAFKEEGIYIKITPYFHSWMTVKKAWEWEQYDMTHTGHMTLLLFFVEKFQKVYKARVKKLMNTVNPRTGLSLAEDPALAVFQIQEEDSFFYSFHPIMLKSKFAEDFSQLYGEFLLDKYGSVEAIYDSWDMNPDDIKAVHDYEKRKKAYDKAIAKGEWWAQNPAFTFSDRPEEKTFGFVSTMHLAKIHNAKGVSEQRIADQLEFFRTLMLDFNTEMRKFLREEIGYQGMISSCNWKGGQEANLYDLERSTYLNDDVIDKHHYFAVPHNDPDQDHGKVLDVEERDSYSHISALSKPGALPGPVYKQVRGKPAIISAGGWNAPNKYQPESPLIVSAYSAMTGVAGFMWAESFFPGFNATMRKRLVEAPSVLGQFPAAALIYRKRYVQEAGDVVIEKRSLQSMYQRDESRIGESMGYAPNSDYKYEFGVYKAEDALSPLSFLVGKVKFEVTNFNNLWQDELMLDMLIDKQQGYVESLTGELRLYWRDLYSTINTPKAQGVVGQFKGKEIELADISIESENEFAGVVAVSLDDKPLSESSKILIQAMTEFRPYGWAEEPNTFQVDFQDPDFEGHKIISIGNSTANVKKVRVTVNFDDSFDEAYGLDENGYISKEKEPLNVRRRHVTLPENSLYTIIYRD